MTPWEKGLYHLWNLRVCCMPKKLAWLIRNMKHWLIPSLQNQTEHSSTTDPLKNTLKEFSLTKNLKNSLPKHSKNSRYLQSSTPSMSSTPKKSKSLNCVFKESALRQRTVDYSSNLISKTKTNPTQVSSPIPDSGLSSTSSSFTSPTKNSKSSTSDSKPKLPMR